MGSEHLKIPTRNLEGQRFDKLSVLREVERAANGQHRYHCRCDCGREVVVTATRLLDGIATSCGCDKPPRGRHVQIKNRDLRGQRFGKLVVICKSDDKIRGGTAWDCKCDCGNIVTVAQQGLIGNHTRSCGCLLREKLKERNTTHGHSQDGPYNTWSCMIARCEIPTTEYYDRYGRRGIKVCQEWHDYTTFYNWAMSTGWVRGLTIDRINPNGNYEPSNCRWATNQEQQWNRENTRRVMYYGEEHVVAELAHEMGIDQHRVHNRLFNGWTPEDAFDIPFNLPKGEIKKLHELSKIEAAHLEAFRRRAKASKEKCG